jgi:hypothetical protein
MNFTCTSCIICQYATEIFFYPMPPHVRQGLRGPRSRLWPKYSRPSSYDRLDIRTTWVTTNILVLTYDQILIYDPHAGQVHLRYDPHVVRKLQSEPRYACLWT